MGNMRVKGDEVERGGGGGADYQIHGPDLAFESAPEADTAGAIAISAGNEVSQGHAVIGQSQASMLGGSGCKQPPVCAHCQGVLRA